MKTEMTTKCATLVAKGQAYVTTAVITAAGTRMFRGPVGGQRGHHHYMRGYTREAGIP